MPNQPVTALDAAYILNRPQAISKFYNYDLGTTTFTDKTTEINSTTESPFNLFDDAPATGDIIYIGGSYPFLGLDIVLSTNGADTGSTAIDWEYWNGTTWTDITETDVDTGASIFTADGRFTWTYPYGSTKVSVNSTEALHYIRGTLTDDYSTDPIVSTMTMRDSINTVFEMRNLVLQNNTIWFQGQGLVQGVNNIRVDYQYGTVTTPTYITDLAVSIAALDAYISLSGGSYDDATSYTLGSKSVTIGEVYVNIREVISQFRKRIEDVYKLVGKRAYIATI
jgi:hypothetical protein